MEEYSREVGRWAEESDKGLFMGISTYSGGSDDGIGVDDSVVVSILPLLWFSNGSALEEMDVSDVMRLKTEVWEESREEMELFRTLGRVGLSDRLGKGLLADGTKGVNF
jgi:hypothetical protein